jgi:triosephosphate isomerase (TIM)
MQTMRCHAAPARAAARRAQAALPLAMRSAACPAQPTQCSSSARAAAGVMVGLAPRPSPQQQRRAVSCAASTGKFFIGGNWKCNGTHASVEKLVSELNAAAATVPSDVDVVVAPPFLFIDWVRANIKGPFQVRG